MPNPLVECIPNFSEARRPEVVDAIINAIKSVPGIHVLDLHSDLDHNRSVVTFIGSPASVEEAAYQGILKASQLIDLNVHTGEHPRIGAADVVPFVPISQISMQECVEMARRLGERVGREIAIPVYLYEEAATRPERQNLENIRRGQYEGLKSEIGINPNRDPDFGPAEVGPAGATVIGARQPLIAFNVFLTTNDTGIAQKIARAIRNSSGGLRYVKAMGVSVEGHAQVSMNLINYRQSPIARTVEMIRREAARYGVGIERSELVGLIPQEALVNAAKWYLQLDDLDANQILENRLFEQVSEGIETLYDTTSDDFLENLASAEPTPAGGSAAAYTCAAAAALVVMAARITIGKKKYQAYEDQMVAIRDQAEELRLQLMKASSKDSSAYDAFLNAMRLPKDNPEQEKVRDVAMQHAILQTAEVPLSVADNALKVMELAADVARSGNINAIADVATAGMMAQAGFDSSCMIVRANLKGLRVPESGAHLLKKIEELEITMKSPAQRLAEIVKERSILSMPGMK